MRNTKAQSTTQQTAADCYAERYAEVQDLFKRIASRLAEHKKRQAAAPADWGYTGDLGRITEQLAYVLADLGDPSAVDAKGLEFDRWGHLKKEFSNGTHRIKLSRIAARHELATPFGWAKVASGYYKNLHLTADDQLAGMTR